MPDNKKELMMYRMTGAKEKLDSAKLLLDNGNYKDFYTVSQKDATEQFEKADEFVKVVEAYLEREMPIVFDEDERNQAFQRLESMRRKVDNLDYEAELAAYREEYLL